MDAQKKSPLGLKLLPSALLMALSSPALLAQSVTTVMIYDAGDHVASVTDPRGLVTTYTHDGLGHLLQQVSPDTGTVNYAYDGYGRPSSMTRADGVQTTYGYDGLNRRTSVSAGGQTQTYAYDNCTNGLGRLCSDSDATGATSYSYTPEGWMAGRGFSVGGTTYALGFSYSATGRPTVISYPDGNVATYTYTNGAISSVGLKVGSTAVNGATAITYRPADLAMSAWTSSNGLTNTLSYDTDGRLTGISVPNEQSLSFNYDTVNRITQITNGINNTLTQNFGYDYMSRLVSVYAAAENESYQYDANGNRTTGTVNGVTQTYTYSPTSNQLTNVSSGVSAQYGYDANGNTTLVNGTSSYQYDPYTRLDASGGATDYVNPEGQRLRKTGGSTGTTYFAPSTDGALLAEDDNGTWVDYVPLNGRLIGRISAGQVSAIHDDQVGRPEVVTDASQNVVWLAQNFAFTQKVTTANITLNLGFPGQYYDTERQTWNNGYRDYISNEGRYLESDPSGLAGGISTYVYVNNNPLSFSDALGLKPGDAFSTANAAAIDVLNFINPTSISNNREYAGLIYSANGSFYATPPVGGTLDKSNPLDPSTELYVKNALGTPIGEFHTHGNYSTSAGAPTNKANSDYGDDCFSEDDITHANAMGRVIPGYMSYLGTPSGNFFQYNSSTGATSSLH